MSTRIFPAPERIAPVVASTDGALQLGMDPGGVLWISGVASGEADSGAGSEVRLSFEGAWVSVALRPGMTPAQTFRMLEKVMPQGYGLNPVAPGVGPADEVRCELVRRSEARNSGGRIQRMMA
jgi:hypothetical protein